MSKKKKYDKVKIEPKKIWEVGKGHHQLSGGGEHDNRPKRRRTRAARNRAAMKDW